nr:MAG TPA: hypothetical protein [Caudoviricetes sp.]
MLTLQYNLFSPKVIIFFVFYLYNIFIYYMFVFAVYL